MYPAGTALGTATEKLYPPRSGSLLKTPAVAPVSAPSVTSLESWALSAWTSVDVPYPALQHSYVQWEGTAGVMRAQMGVNLDYPKGRGDTLDWL